VDSFLERQGVTGDALQFHRSRDIPEGNRLFNIPFALYPKDFAYFFLIFAINPHPREAVAFRLSIDRAQFVLRKVPSPSPVVRLVEDLVSSVQPRRSSSEAYLSHSPSGGSASREGLLFHRVVEDAV
jgi:hypothetical protein